MKKPKSEYAIQTVTNALRLLDVFRDEEEVGVAELARRLGLHKNNVFRLLATLEEQGYIEQCPVSERYRLGIGSLELGHSFLRSRTLCGRARPILEEMWQRSGRRVSRGNSLGSFLGDAFSVYYAAALIAIRRDAGEGGEIGELMTAIRDNVRRYQEAGLGTDSLHFQQSIDYETGLADFLSGDRDQGLALIARAVEDGFFILPNEAYLQVLYNDPGFAPIRAMQVARQKRERNRLLAIVCNDNPYETVWRPAEGTCEQLIAASEN